MKCPSCDCNSYGSSCSSCSSCDQCSSSCGCAKSCVETTTTTKRTFLKRLYAKFIVAKDRNGCDVALDPGTTNTVLVSDGKKTWFADGSTGKPIKLDNIGQLTDALTLMGIRCDGIIGKVSSASATPEYLQISAAGITTTPTVPDNQTVFDPAKIPSTNLGKIAAWTCNGLTYQLSQLQGPDPTNVCCTKKYFLTFDCVGDSAFTLAIESLSDLISGCLNTGALILYDGAKGYQMNMTELTTCPRTRWNIIFDEQTSLITLPATCVDAVGKELTQITRTWYKTKDWVQLDTDMQVISDITTDPVAGTVADNFELAALLREGAGTTASPYCRKLVKITLKENELITADANGVMVKKTFASLSGQNAGQLEAGRIQFMDAPAVLATASATVDLTTIFTVPFCAGKLFGFFAAKIAAGNNQIGTISVNGIEIAKGGSSNTNPNQNWGSNWVRIDDPAAVNITISGAPGSQVTISAIACQ